MPCANPRASFRAPNSPAPSFPACIFCVTPRPRPVCRATLVMQLASERPAAPPRGRSVGVGHGTQTLPAAGASTGIVLTFLRACWKRAAGNSFWIRMELRGGRGGSLVCAWRLQRADLCSYCPFMLRVCVCVRACCGVGALSFRAAGMSQYTTAHVMRVQRLYRQALKLVHHWAIDREVHTSVMSGCVNARMCACA